MRPFISRFLVLLGWFFSSLSIAAPISDDQVFAYAEANYPSLFPGTATNQQYQEYNYRYYSATKNYLAIDSSGVIFMLGPDTRNVLTAVGPVSAFASAITDWEAKANSHSMSFALISLGYSTVLGIDTNGNLWGWGWNSHGELGDGTRIDASKPKLLGSGYISVSASSGGESYILAVKSDGTLLSWGADLFNTGAPDILSPQVIGTGGFVSVSSATYYQAALKSDGSLWTWGRNSSGLAGDGSTRPISAPKQIGVGFAKVSTGTTHAMAIKNDGSLWAWGDGNCGALGPGTVVNIAGYVSLKIPTQIGAGYKDAVAFGSSTIALKTDGSLWSWGQTYNGRLGDGVTANSCRSAPKQIGSGYTAIAAGYGYAMALKSDGSVWSWGHLSVSSTKTGADSAVPKQIGTGFVKIFMGAWRAYAVSADGGLWAWGDEYDSGFSNTYAYSAVPIRVQ